MMRLVTFRPWDLVHRETSEVRRGALPPGDYAVELHFDQRFGHTRRFLALAGEPWGASLGSWCQRSPLERNNFTGEPAGWEEFECRVYDDRGRLLDETGMSPLERPPVTAEQAAARRAGELESARRMEECFARGVAILRA